MKKCMIITSYLEGSLTELMNGFEPDLILCADGGYDHAIEAGIIPDFLIGDFDSLKGHIRSGTEIIKVPAEKDDTDTGLCVQAALDMGGTDILILGGMGGRFDHAAANIQVMAGAAPKLKRIAMADYKNYCTVLCSSSRTFPKKKNQHLSVLSLSDISTGVSISGVQYPLSDYTLYNTFPLGISNEYIDEHAQISVKNGTLLVILSED